MRTSLAWGLLFSLIGACGTTPAVAVVHERAPASKGDPVKIRRGAQEPFAGVKPGFFVVRTRDDWAALWPEGSAPPLPPTLDTSRSMLLLAIAEPKGATGILVKRVTDLGETIEVVVKEATPGDGCVTRMDRPAFDAVIVDRIDKPMRFYVEDEPGEACGAPPKADVQCRVGSDPHWSPAITAQIGDVVECNMNATAGGRFEVTDRVLHLGELPPGSATKLAYSQGPTRGTFTVDVFGKYGVRAEATDDSGRRGQAVATIEVSPPKTKDVLVQLAWTGFDANDDPDTFPRVTLHAIEEGPKGRDCSAETPVAGWCEAKSKSAFTNMKITAGAPKKATLVVTYKDERVEKGPAVCIHTYFDGERAFETCDRKHRNAEDKWEVGTLDPATGKIAPPPEPKAIADAGAPDAAPAPPKKKKK